MDKILDKHKEHFQDIDSLFDYQKNVLQLLQRKRNTLAIIPTGGGKSLLYQLMALELPGVTIVVSPLLALMEEQVDELNNERNITALGLNSNLSFINQRTIIRSLVEENYKIIYVSPERLQNPFFRAGIIASGVTVSMIAIDEAHCISQWGSNFRPDYGHINSFANFLTDNRQAPFLFCLTATLCKEARSDIIREFEIDDGQIFINENIIRDNLDLSFKKVNEEKEKVSLLRDFLSTVKPSKTLVYLYSQVKCEELASKFLEDYATNAFHSGLKSEVKNKAYGSFLNNDVELMFATTAFGMGINIPDIESVIHYHIPNSIEEYYQQVGRGWRKRKEKKTCSCLALWSDTNFKRRKENIEREKYTSEKLIAAFNLLLGTEDRKEGQIVNKDKNALRGTTYNLRLIKYKLEKYGVIRTIGEINGSPLSIKMKKNTELWKKVLQTAESGMDSFRYVCDVLEVEISYIIEHLYNQDLIGNIEKLPAMERDIFIEILKPELDGDIIQNIISEISAEVDFRIRQLEELKELFESNDHSQKLREAFS